MVGWLSESVFASPTRPISVLDAFELPSMESDSEIEESIIVSTNEKESDAADLELAQIQNGPSKLSYSKKFRKVVLVRLMRKGRKMINKFASFIDNHAFIKAAPIMCPIVFSSIMCVTQNCFLHIPNYITDSLKLQTTYNNCQINVYNHSNMLRNLQETTHVINNNQSWHVIFSDDITARQIAKSSSMVSKVLNVSPRHCQMVS